VGVRGLAPAAGWELGSLRFGVALGRLNPAFFVDVVDEAERLGLESVWLPEHLVLRSGCQPRTAARKEDVVDAHVARPLPAM